MARLNSSFEFTGRVGNITAYTLKGSDKIIIRKKGGPSREKIKKLESFAVTREMNTEWAGCAKAGKGILQAILPVKHVADYNIIGPLNAIAKTIQKLDKVNVSGERSVRISRHRDLLDGFPLNRKYTFDSMIRRNIIFRLDRETGSAVVEIPALTPGIHLVNGSKGQLFRFSVVLGIVSDLEFSGDYSKYSPLNQQAHTKNCFAETDWYPAFEDFSGTMLNLELEKNIVFGATETLLLAIGIEFGNKLTNGVEPLRYSGSGKILGVR